MSEENAIVIFFVEANRKEGEYNDIPIAIPRGFQ